MNGPLVLTDKAAEGTGATLNASTLTASKEITVSEKCNNRFNKRSCS